MAPQTLTLRVLTDEALLIIQQLVRIHQLEFVSAAPSPAEQNEEPPAPTGASRWRGIISKERGKEMLREAEKMRNEWDRDF